MNKCYSVVNPRSQVRSDTADVRRYWHVSGNQYTEENTMLNKVVVLVIFGPKYIFDASKNSY